MSNQGTRGPKIQIIILLWIVIRIALMIAFDLL